MFEFVEFAGNSLEFTKLLPIARGHLPEHTLGIVPPNCVKPEFEVP